MTVLVTGGAGFIGSHLVERLVAQGQSVRVLDDGSSGNWANLVTLPSPLEVVELRGGTITQFSMCRLATKGVKVVYHLAARTGVGRSVEDPLETDRVNTHGTLNLLQAAHEAGVRRVVFTSSSSVYGGSLASDEMAPLRPRSPYAASKLAGEMYCRVFVELYGLGAVVLRLFNVYGPRQRGNAVVPAFIRLLSQGEPVVIEGDGEQTRDFTYVEDVVDALVLAGHLATPVSGAVFNIGPSEPRSVNQLFEELARQLGSAASASYTAERPGDVRHSYAGSRTVGEQLGWAPRTSFEDGLAMTLAWAGERPLGALLSPARGSEVT
jgi:nucleoside-diphosphate-sugar epimerase